MESGVQMNWVALYWKATVLPVTEEKVRYKRPLGMKPGRDKTVERVYKKVIIIQYETSAV